MVEADPRAGKDVVTLTVIDGDPMGVDFSDAVGAAGIERRRFVLWCLAYFAEHLTRRGLIKFAIWLVFPNRLEHPRRAGSGNIHCQHRLIPGGWHERLGSKIVDFVGSNRPYGIVQRGLIGEVPFDDFHAVENMLDTVEALKASPSDHPIHGIAFS